jgi:hypothetical protein
MIRVIDSGDTFSQGFGVSHGGIAVGRSIRAGASQAFIWTLDSGIIGLPNLAARSYTVSNSANDKVLWLARLRQRFLAPTGCR